MAQVLRIQKGLRGVPQFRKRMDRFHLGQHPQAEERFHLPKRLQPSLDVGAVGLLPGI